MGTTRYLFVLLCLALILPTILCAPKTLTKEQKVQRQAQNWEKINKFTKNEFVSNVKSEAEFNEYVIRSPRNYTLLLLFNSERECFACRQVDEVYEAVSRIYESQKNVTADGTELFFLRVPVESAYSIGVKLKIRGVPAILWVPEVSGTGFSHKGDQVLYYASNNDGIDGYVFTQWLHSKTGIMVPGFTQPIDYEYYITRGGPGLLIFITAYLLIFHFKNPMTWLTITLFLYFVNMSGTIGNIVHDNPPYQYNMWTGETFYISKSLQRQFAYEGYIASALLLTAAVAIMTLTSVLPRVRAGIRQRLLFWFLLAIIVISLNSWMEIYFIKNPGYPFQYFFEWRTLQAWGLATIHEWTGYSFNELI